MAFLTNSLADNKPLAIAIAIIVILLGLALVAVIYRALRGNRIRTSSARGRQQRLGVVDTHDIGADRQLVIVRRDNVEHLILIGGPNDVLVEPSIVRAEMREGRGARDRETVAPAWAAGETSPPGVDQRPPAPEPAPPPIEEPPAKKPEPSRETSRLPDLFSRARKPQPTPPEKPIPPETAKLGPVAKPEPPRKPEPAINADIAPKVEAAPKVEPPLAKPAAALELDMDKLAAALAAPEPPAPAALKPDIAPAPKVEPPKFEPPKPATPAPAPAK